MKKSTVHPTITVHPFYEIEIGSNTKQAVNEKLEILVDNLFINCTHHISMGVEYSVDPRRTSGGRYLQQQEILLPIWNWIKIRIMLQMAKNLGWTSIRHRSDALASEKCYLISIWGSLLSELFHKPSSRCMQITHLKIRPLAGVRELFLYTEILTIMWQLHWSMFLWVWTLLWLSLQIDSNSLVPYLISPGINMMAFTNRE